MRKLGKRRIASSMNVVMMIILHTVLNSVLDEQGWSTLRPRRFTLNERPQVSSR
jgi:hypothetical protein